MGLFRRRRAAEPPSSGHPLDDQTLAGLAGIGANPAIPRFWEHFVYCRDGADLPRLMAAAADAGWDVRASTGDEPGFVASRSDLPVNARTVPEARRFFTDLAASVPGGDYDGWGASGD